MPAKWLSGSSDKVYFTRLSRDMKRMDVCVADANTGDVRAIVEERLNTYIESRPLRLINNGQDLLFWSERDGWGHYYVYDANTGALKNRVTEGEFVSMLIDSVVPAAPLLNTVCATTPTPKTIRMNVPKNSASISRNTPRGIALLPG